MGGMAAQIPIAGDDEANEQRAGARARRQGARSRRRPRRHLGRAPGADSVAQEIFDARMPRRTSSTSCARTWSPAATRCCSSRWARSPRRLREQRRGVRALPRRLARRQRLRADPLADGRRRHRRDCRAQLWSWLQHGGLHLDDGTPVDETLFDRALLGLPAKLGDRLRLPARSASSRRSRCSNASPMPANSPIPHPPAYELLQEH
jgi:malate synthase